MTAFKIHALLPYKFSKFCKHNTEKYLISKLLMKQTNTEVKVRCFFFYCYMYEESLAFVQSLLL